MQRTQASLSFTRIVTGTGERRNVGPSACIRNGVVTNLPDPTDASGNPFPPGTTRNLGAASSFNLGETVFLSLEDRDQNLDPGALETVEVGLFVSGAGDRETVRLTETSPASGIFTGYIPSVEGAAASGDCVLQGGREDRLTAGYRDPADSGDGAEASAVFDPAGRVFDSSTGEPVDGVRVSLIDAATGAPARVLGNDGRSGFPASIVTGSQVTDQSGTTYDFRGGRFRFPSVPAGDYRLAVEPPETYAAPSAAIPSELQRLAAAPFDLVEASFDGVYRHDGNGPFSFDYPLDPVAESLYVQKTTSAITAAPGDFLRYEITVRNTSDASAARNLRVVDLLPPGTRYVRGSATLGGKTSDEPALVSSSHLEFAFAQLAPDAALTIGYVLEVVAGREGDRLRNDAFAEAEGGLRSNRSSATVRLSEDLFRSTSTLIGRVIEGNCASQAFSEDSGVAGIRVYLEDGRYAVTDAGGRFHFEGLPAGTHVAQLDPGTVPAHFIVTGCDAAGRFAGRGDSQIVELSGGSMQQANFYLRRRLPPEGAVNLSLRTGATETRDRVTYDVDLEGRGEVGVESLTLSVLLPEGVAYRAGSLRMDGAAADPRIDGQALTLDLGERAGDWRTPVTFAADIDAEASGELVSRALARFRVSGAGREQSPVAETIIRREPATRENAGYVLGLKFGVLSAELSADDRAELDALIENWQGVRDVRITAVGHSDSTRISARSRHRFADNYALSRARALSAARYLAAGLDVDEADIQVDGRGPDEPVAANDTPSGREQNRRVELVLAGSRPGRQSFVEVAKASSGLLVTETRGAAPGADSEAKQRLAAAFLEEHLSPPQQSDVSIDVLEAGLDWVLPEPGFRPSIPAIRVAIKHGADQTVALFVNGLEVDPVNFEGRTSDPARNIAVSRWAGVDLLEGSNQFVADIIGSDGRLADRLTRRVHFAGAPVRAEVDLEASTLIADGRTRPVVAVRLYDRFGEPARHSSIAAFSVDAPYRSWWAEMNDRENKLVQIGNREPLLTVGDDGIAYIELAPTPQSGQATLRLRLQNQREQEISAWLKPSARDWILVGFGEGTVGYRALSANAVPTDGDGGEDYYEDGRLAFFAKGSIKGEYLLTLAYDSARKRNADTGFATEIDPTAWYPLYADAAEQRFEAPSQRKLYVKLERAQFSALFGDFATGLSTTELSRYERRMNGFRSEYSGTHAGFVAFASENAQKFVRDEIPGDGTSGLYRLSRSPVLPMSESVRIEVRDRFDPAEVISSRSLSRFLDYSLDAGAGTLFFRQPVPNRDESFNPVYIVAEYETSSGQADDVTAGGRVSVYTGDRRLEAGLTHIVERAPALSSELSAVDLRWQATPATVVRAEVATSETAADSGSASLVRVEHRGEKLDLGAEYRDVDQDFGLGLQRAAEQGIRKLGIDGRYEMTSEVAVRANASLQENLETGAERTVADADIEYQTSRTTATLGITHAEDRFLDGESQSSNIVDAGISRRLLDSALSVRANGSLGLGSDTGNADYLTSYVFGVDYRVASDVDLFLEYENAEGRDIDADMSRIGVRATPWSRARLDTSVSNEMSEYGPRLYSNLGLVQGFQLSERWLVDIGMDQVRTIRQPALRRFDDEREPAFGSLNDDFTAGYLGTLYQSDLWSLNSRIEYRNADSERRMSLLAGWYREPSLGHGLSAGLTVFRSERDEGESIAANLRFGWALRRADSPWAFLYRADLDHEKRALQQGAESTWRIVSNFNANRRIGAASQLSLQYAAKFVRSNFGAVTAEGYSDLAGVDLRRGFRERWEVALHGSAYHAWQSGTVDYGGGLSLGFNLAEDMWISIGYNVEGFHDEDFAAARYTSAGPYLRVTMRAHQDQLKRITGR